MQALTQDVAERCAKCCGWKLLTKNGGDFVPFPNRPLDPLFWFGRLWEKWEQSIVDQTRSEPGTVQTDKILKCNTYLKGTGHTRYEVSTQVRRIDGGDELYRLDYGADNHPCLALCVAIEALEKGK